ncbi:MAG: hypothetical protein EOO64_00020 [Massilia sp.]|nr:MAG: hypothetical protein EOO64_00020 [Massilia sp.]
MISFPRCSLRVSLTALSMLLLQCLSPAHAADRAPTPLPVVAPKAAGFSPQRLDALHRRIEGEVAAGIAARHLRRTPSFASSRCPKS